MSFAVAMTKTLSFLSFNHVRNVPKIRLVVPASAPSPPPPANAFSISSIQRTIGAICSAVFTARLRFFSLSPTYLL